MKYRNYKIIWRHVGCTKTSTEFQSKEIVSQIIFTNPSLLFTHSWRENNWIHTFPKGISAMWNAISHVQDLKSCRRVHFLQRWPLHHGHLSDACLVDLVLRHIKTFRLFNDKSCKIVHLNEVIASFVLICGQALSYKRLLSHPPYSQDLVPSDYHLFSSMKEGLRGKYFTSGEELKTVVMNASKNS